MSGECFCGAFARPNEIELIRRYAPDVAEEIDSVAQLAPPGKGNVWGVRAKSERGILTVGTGPLCSSCDYKAQASGLLFGDGNMSGSLGEFRGCETLQAKEENELLARIPEAKP